MYTGQLVASDHECSSLIHTHPIAHLQKCVSNGVYFWAHVVRCPRELYELYSQQTNIYKAYIFSWTFYFCSISFLLSSLSTPFYYACWQQKKPAFIFVYFSQFSTFPGKKIKPLWSSISAQFSYKRCFDKEWRRGIVKTLKRFQFV